MALSRIFFRVHVRRSRASALTQNRQKASLSLSPSFWRLAAPPTKRAKKRARFCIPQTIGNLAHGQMGFAQQRLRALSFEVSLQAAITVPLLQKLTTQCRCGNIELLGEMRQRWPLHRFRRFQHFHHRTYSAFIELISNQKRPWCSAQETLQGSVAPVHWTLEITRVKAEGTDGGFKHNRRAKKLAIVLFVPRRDASKTERLQRDTCIGKPAC